MSEIIPHGALGRRWFNRVGGNLIRPLESTTIVAVAQVTKPPTMERRASSISLFFPSLFSSNLFLDLKHRHCSLIETKLKLREGATAKAGLKNRSAHAYFAFRLQNCDTTIFNYIHREVLYIYRTKHDLSIEYDFFACAEKNYKLTK